MNIPQKLLVQKTGVSGVMLFRRATDCVKLLCDGPFSLMLFRAIHVVKIKRCTYFTLGLLSAVLGEQVQI